MVQKGSCVRVRVHVHVHVHVYVRVCVRAGPTGLGGVSAGGRRAESLA